MDTSPFCTDLFSRHAVVSLTPIHGIVSAQKTILSAEQVGGEGGEDGLEDYGLSTAFLLKRTRDETDSWLW